MDCSLPPLPFDEKLFTEEPRRKLRIGYYYDDGYQPPVQACVRAVRVARENLEGAGHTLVPFKVPDVEKFMFTMFAGIMSDGGAGWIPMFKNDEMTPSLRHLSEMGQMNKLKRIIKLQWLKICGERRAMTYLHLAGSGDVMTRTKVNHYLDMYKSNYFKMWDDLELDCLICPAFSVPASPDDVLDPPHVVWNYTTMFNVLDCPAGVVPMTKVTRDDIESLDSYQGHYNDTYDKQIQNASRESVGMPVGVQCVAAPYKDEMCLRLMQEVDSLNEN